MDKIIRIGMDTSKNVFQLHGVNEAEQPVLRKKLRRNQVLAFFAGLPPLKIGMEACGSAHYWARELRALGHEVVLLPPQYVKPYVKRSKSDAADAQAICEAMSRPDMRFVPTKSAAQQGSQMLAKLRAQFIGRRTQLANSIRGFAAEFGLVAPKGLSRLGDLLADIRADATIPDTARDMFETLARDYAHIGTEVATLDEKLLELHRQSEMSRRLAAIPAIGPVGATLLAIKVTDAHGFKSGRDFAAWLGLTPKNHSTAGKNRLGVITRAGDEMLRSVLVVGATALIQHMRRGSKRVWPWLSALIARKAPKLAAVALANKLARIAWKLMISGEQYRPVDATCPAPVQP
ncbi:IS110 family RNA-guided transposase [Mesorhizobium neociceri]|uniref:IS110 family transposase n=1 Tax=Mesorhizobium neociceri TaxID=1307853 RepID=A0A838B4W6_9HYPH|nr:IS110 family transposase [Mesorhizobium neociceri]MBA1141062.1 IS110 family transposase [Mesorhizobium neociceri]